MEQKIEQMIRDALNYVAEHTEMSSEQKIKILLNVLSEYLRSKLPENQKEVSHHDN